MTEKSTEPTEPTDPTEHAALLASDRPTAWDRAGRLLAGFSGALTVALVLLGLAVLGARLVVGTEPVAGVVAVPRWVVIAVHLAAAAACVVLQRWADRATGLVRAGCAAAVLAIAATVFVLYWWF